MGSVRKVQNRPCISQQIKRKKKDRQKDINYNLKRRVQQLRVKDLNKSIAQRD